MAESSKESASVAEALEAATIDIVPIPDNGVVVIVDPLSTGVMLAAQFLKRNIPLLRVFSRSFPERCCVCHPQNIIAAVHEFSLDCCCINNNYLLLLRFYLVF